MATGIGVLFSKIWSFLSSPFGHIATSAIEAGGRKIGEKITSQVEKMFEIGEKSLGDEIACDNVLEGMDDKVRESFEDFMGWLQEQQPDGNKKAEKIREVIIKKITSKEIRTGGGKKGGQPLEVKTEFNYDSARNFIERMMCNTDHGAILLWLKKKNFFSTVGIEKKSNIQKVSEKAKQKAKSEAKDVKDMLESATQWLKENKKQ